jgi:hypothetical protein
MSKHLFMAAFLLAPISTCSAIGIDDYSFIEATGAFGPIISANRAMAYFPCPFRQTFNYPQVLPCPWLRSRGKC